MSAREAAIEVMARASAEEWSRGSWATLPETGEGSRSDYRDEIAPLLDALLQPSPTNCDRCFGAQMAGSAFHADPLCLRCHGSGQVTLPSPFDALLMERLEQVEGWAVVKRDPDVAEKHRWSVHTANADCSPDCQPLYIDRFRAGGEQPDA